MASGTCPQGMRRSKFPPPKEIGHAMRDREIMRLSCRGYINAENAHRISLHPGFRGTRLSYRATWMVRDRVPS